MRYVPACVTMKHGDKNAPDRDQMHQTAINPPLILHELYTHTIPSTLATSLILSVEVPKLTQRSQHVC